MTIPPALLKLMKLDVGSEVSLSVAVANSSRAPARIGKKRYSLNELR